MQIKSFAPNVNSKVISCRPECHFPEAVKVTQLILSFLSIRHAHNRDPHSFSQNPWEFCDWYFESYIYAGPLGKERCILMETFSDAIAAWFLSERKGQLCLKADFNWARWTLPTLTYSQHVKKARLASFTSYCKFLAYRLNYEPRTF